MKAPFLPIKAVKHLSILAVVVACFACTNAFAQSTDDWNWEHPLPGFGPEISLDRGLGTVYTMVKNNSISDIDAFNILAGRTRFLKLDSDGGIGDLLPAMECDGGYAFLTAYLARERNIRNPAVTLDYDQLKKESPSMNSLINGFDDFLRLSNFERAESYFLESIFINAYQDVSIAEQKVEHYLSNPQSREAIITEVNGLFSKLTFDLAEYRSCNPESDSSRLMLAQWAAWGLTNLNRIEWENGNKTKEDGDIINSIEKSVRLKTGRIRASGGTFYVSRRETDGYDF